MKKLLFFSTLVLWMGSAILPGSADDQKPAATAEKTAAGEAKSSPSKPATVAKAKVSTPTETKPVETKPAGTKPADPKPTETKPAETKPVAAKPAESKPPEAKPAAAPVTAASIEIKTIPDDKNTCIACHASEDIWDPKETAMYKNYLPKKTCDALKNDVHWKKGVRCQDCHGGDATEDSNPVKAHHGKDNFHAIKSAADVPDFCGRCHSNIEYMRRFNPSPRTDQLAEYWTSGHGTKLKKGDLQVATCISCHDQPHGNATDPQPHGIRPVNEPVSPVYHTKVAQTCAKCHSDRKLMAGRTYNRKPLPCDEYEKWSTSVHGVALLKKGDLSAPTCNNCHGNHGAAPPQMDSVANACGACHGKIAGLFAQTKMRHKFESVGLPGCATCHSNHDIHQPSDDFLGMQSGAFCARCHEEGKEKYGATLEGRKAAKTIHAGLEELKNGIQKAEATLSQAEIKGMEVSVPKFDLQKASDALTNARTQIHSFQVDVVQKALGEGEKVVTDVQTKADQALEQYQFRRVWLGVSLVPILIVIGLLLLYIRVLPIPEKPAFSENEAGTGK